jgi:NAD(P)-dependent dehydrogenase (short-subunit alcohol dehydrogenase family)
LLLAAGAIVPRQDLGTGEVRRACGTSGVACGSTDGSSLTTSTVADKIIAAGGAAIADTSDVATPAGAQRLIDAAIEEFGHLDILVNNAGIIRWAGFPDADAENLAMHLAVHVGGSFNTARAAWPHLVERGYGRIVMTTSSGLFGLPKNLAYATAKGGVIGLTRSLTVAGAAHGIKVNLIAPAAFTRMAGQPEHDDSPDRSPGPPQMSPDLVAPMVAFLAHEACPVSSEIYTAGAGRFARLFIASTEGYVSPTSEPSIEDVAQNWAVINDETGYYVPADLMAWSAAFMAHLPPTRGEPAAS